MGRIEAVGAKIDAAEGGNNALPPPPSLERKIGAGSPMPGKPDREAVIKGDIKNALVRFQSEAKKCIERAGQGQRKLTSEMIHKVDFDDAKFMSVLKKAPGMTEEWIQSARGVLSAYLAPRLSTSPREEKGLTEAYRTVRAYCKGIADAHNHSLRQKAVAIDQNLNQEIQALEREAVSALAHKDSGEARILWGIFKRMEEERRRATAVDMPPLREAA